MQEPYLEYILSDEKALLQPERILALLKETAWARHYTLDTIDGIIRNSLCMALMPGECRWALPGALRMRPLYFIWKMW